jgi:hypothetical protein
MGKNACTCSAYLLRSENIRGSETYHHSWGYLSDSLPDRGPIFGGVVAMTSRARDVRYLNWRNNKSMSCAVIYGEACG